MPHLENLVKVNGKDEFLTIDTHCHVCMGKDAGGEYVRPALDKLSLTAGVPTLLDFLAGKGVVVTEKEVSRHLSRHCDYLRPVRASLRKAVDQTPISSIEQMVKHYVDPDEVLQSVVNIGAARISSGEIPVTGGLLMRAIKEQTARKTGGAVKDLLDQLERSRFGLPGKVLEGQVSDTAGLLTDSTSTEPEKGEVEK